MNSAEFLRTVREWNKAVRTDVPFNPNIKDGRCTLGLAVDKSNWANTIDTPPFEGYAVTCGVTLHLAACASTQKRRCSTPTTNRSVASMPRASSSVASSTSTIQVALGSCPALYLVKSPVLQPIAKCKDLSDCEDKLLVSPINK